MCGVIVYILLETVYIHNVINIYILTNRILTLYTSSDQVKIASLQLCNAYQCYSTIIGVGTMGARLPQ